jgi:hypothetical protein
MTATIIPFPIDRESVNADSLSRRSDIDALDHLAVDLTTPSHYVCNQCGRADFTVRFLMFDAPDEHLECSRCYQQNTGRIYCPRCAHRLEPDDWDFCHDCDEGDECPF